MKAHEKKHFLLPGAIDSDLVQEACCIVSLHTVLHTSAKHAAIRELLKELTSRKSFSSLKEKTEPVLNRFLYTNLKLMSTDMFSQATLAKSFYSFL